MAVLQLTSPKNSLLKDVRHAVSRGGLTADGFCVAEGFHLLKEALRSRCSVHAVLAVEPALERLRALGALPVIEVPPKVFADLSSTETSQGVVALVQPPVWDADQVFGTDATVIVLDSIQDPGNAGAILRVAEAFGASGAVALKGSANFYNPKAIRASAGSLFRLPVLFGWEPTQAVAEMQQRDFRIYAAMPRATNPISQLDFQGPCAIVIGSEGRGVCPEMRAAATGARIPTEHVESLNAAVAAGVLLYEVWRQRHRNT